MAGRVQFILGRAGTGKSWMIQDRLRRLLRADPLGPPVFLLVPAQATFVHERQYALGAGLEGYARLRIVSFENLGDAVIAECGGEAMTQVTPAGRQMLLGHLLRAHADQLGYFRPVARQVGLVQELDRTFGEFERAGRSSAELLEALPDLLGEAAAPEYAALVEKTRDLALLGGAYRDALGDDRLDATRRLEHVMQHLDGCRALRQAHVFVDGFYRLSAFERKFLARLAGVVGEMQIALTLDPHDIERVYDESHLFHQTVTTYRQLRLELEEAGVVPQPPIELTRPYRFGCEALSRIEQDWSKPRPSIAPLTDTSAVTLLEAPDPRAEADAAARQVKQWTDQGLRLREIVVLCRDLSAMQPLLEASFTEHELSFFIDRRRPAGHHPLVRFVRSLLRVAMHGWPHDAVLDLCKCGLAGMHLDEADALENYVLEHRIRGRAAWTSKEPWSYHGGEAAKEDDEAPLRRIDEHAGRVDAIRRRLVERIAPLADALKQARPLRDHLSALWKCVDSFEVRDLLEEQIDAAGSEGLLEEAAEHVQAWEELTGLFDQAVELLGSETLSGADFVATLEYGLDLLDLAIIPPRADEVVIGDVERTRTVGCRAALVLGLNEGTFPRSHADPTVLSDEERRLLRDRQVDVEPDGKSLQLGERFLAYRAFTTPSERLTLTRSVSDGEGRSATPSPYWEHVRTLLRLSPQSLGRESPDAPECIGTPRQLATALMRWARQETDLSGRMQEKAAGLYQFLATHDDPDSALGRVRRLSWRALSYRNEAQLRPETAARLFDQEALNTSASRLESFSACPFRHYATHILQLRTREEGDTVTPRDLGTVYHGVLERLVRHCIREKLRFVDPAAVTPEHIGAWTREIGEELRGRIMLSNARNEYLLRRIELTLQGVLAGQQAVINGGNFEPLASELKFGEGPDAMLPPLEMTTPKGRRVRLHGQIDRVDHSPEGGCAAVIDYKLSDRTLRLDEVSYGLSLQLLLYMLVIQQHGAKLSDPPPRPAAALYVKLLRGIESKRHPDDGLDPSDPAFDLRVKPRGIIDAGVLSHIDRDALECSGSFSSRLFQASVNKGGGLARGEGNDLVESHQLERLLALVAEETQRLADAVIDGVISVRPYKMGTITPCPRCEFQSFCRFDPAQEDYDIREPKKRNQVLDELAGARREAGE